MLALRVAASLANPRPAQLYGHGAYEVISLAVGGLSGATLTVRFLRGTRAREPRPSGIDETLLAVLALALFFFFLRQLVENCQDSYTLGSADRSLLAASRTRLR